MAEQGDPYRSGMEDLSPYPQDQHLHPGGVSRLETLWKVVEAIIDTRLRVSISFHDVLRSLCAGREIGTTIL